MTTPEAADPLDPFEVHFHREPLQGAGVTLILLADTTADPVATAGVFAPCVAWLQGEGGRSVQSQVVPVDRASPRLNALIEAALEAVDQPIVLICSAVEPIAPEYLKPLLESIDKADHVLGRRPTTPLRDGVRRLTSLFRRLVFAVPILDVDSPCQLHRTEKLRAIPLQSGSSFVNVEILAKATFLGHLLDEVEIPALVGTVWGRGRFKDLRVVLKAPTFRPVGNASSAPLEEAEGQPERADRPGGEDGDRLEDVEVREPRAFEDDQAKGADELGQG